MSIAELQKNYKVNATIADDDHCDDEEVENDNPFGDEADGFEMVSDRASMSRRSTFHNQASENKDLEAQLKQLVQMKDDMKTFQTNFC